MASNEKYARRAHAGSGMLDFTAINEKYVRRAHALAGELGITVVTDGLSNGGLAELVADLSAKKRDAANATQADAPAPSAVTDAPQADAPAREPWQEEADKLLGTGSSDPVATVVRYVLLPGKALTTRRGILGEGAEISPADLVGGIDAIQRFIDSGYIVAEAI